MAQGAMMEKSGYPTRSYFTPDELRARLTISYDFYYDFDVDGGAIGDIPLRGEVLLPAGFVIDTAFKEIIVPLDSTLNPIATAALTSGESPADLFPLSQVNSIPWSTPGVARAVITVKTTATRIPTLSIAKKVLTQGKLTLHLTGYIAP